MPEPTYPIPALPLQKFNFDTVAVLKALPAAHRHLAELKGCAKSIPNQGILIDTLILKEAQASSEIESYVTTQDELFRADLQLADAVSPAAKEVRRYREALQAGYRKMKTRQDLITTSDMVELFQILKNSSEGLRTQAGTIIKNERTGDTVYVPPQHAADVQQHMQALERYINEPDASGLDPLIKMAIIHHQFESIHPFSDGNGRLGRILCVLQLTQMQLLDAPVLYLSRYINRYKGDYYRLLQSVRDDGAWHEWVVFMLNAVASTAKSTVTLVEGMRELMADTKQRMRNDMPRIYSQDLLNNLFRHPYTRIEFVQRDLGMSRQTAARYLKQLAQHGIVEEHVKGKHTYFINTPLIKLLREAD